ncbi:ribonuclease Z [Sporosarcina sp. P21c]|uniref:ribonuclease Z n=1 Tax=unclassified Sporosarcina TaxID=2647733 RepID=UPI000C162B75|nr:MULTISPECIES: ribonuclease Z [unclassified Sporosarcina]PIC66883.1 ribonuclease Z [Sporosarcina sp. P16a]PIC89384.1 ribonuclease Z [Sporosarcina sp. P21c]PIC92335.1 ribonuclease Z [Sporosarcina sp. P25]
MDIEFLGTGAGMPSKQRNTSALVLDLTDENKENWLFDCGEATQHQLLHSAIKPKKITKIFITHLHGDHIFGLPGFLSSRAFLGGDDPVDIYGPAGLKEWLQHTYQLTGTYLPYKLNVHEIHDGMILETDEFKVYAKEVQHVIQSFGFRIEQKELPGTLLIDKAIEQGVPKGPLLQRLKDGFDVALENGQTVYSQDVTTDKKKGFVITVIGDTSYCQASVELARDADILIHEATFTDEYAAGAKEFGHSTIVEAATIAKEANAKNLIANHISARFMPSEMPAFKAEGTAVFEAISIADDFTRYQWKHGELIKLAKN